MNREKSLEVFVGKSILENLKKDFGNIAGRNCRILGTCVLNIWYNFQKTG
jgi:hypothetical protein